MRILSIETSCDETAAAIIEAEKHDKTVTLLSNVVASSLPTHAKTGGIIPEAAARQQIQYILPVIKEAFQKANLPMAPESIDAIAVTYGPGLIGSLLVGVETAKTLAYIWDKPIVPVNHLYGHIYANWINPQLSVIGSQLSESGQSVDQFTCQPKTEQQEAENRKQKTDNRISFPSLALIVSGGHTDLVLIKEHGKIQWLGGTRDDAAGEALDKIGRLLNLPYPGGPEIEKKAKEGNPKTYHFPRPMIGTPDFDFSFSGLKTAVNRYVILNKVKNPRDPSASPQDDIILANICASTQQAIIDVLIKKTLKAAKAYKVKSILLGGGVAVNESLRNAFQVNCFMSNVDFFVPQKNLCTDNAAMIGAASFFNYKEVLWKDLTANPELYFD